MDSKHYILVVSDNIEFLFRVRSHGQRHNLIILPFDTPDNICNEIDDLKSLNATIDMVLVDTDQTEILHANTYGSISEQYPNIPIHFTNCEKLQVTPELIPSALHQVN